MEKNIYITPETFVIRISTENLMVSLSGGGDDGGHGTPEIKEFDGLVEDDEE